jgi:serine/threonine protein kinase
VLRCFGYFISREQSGILIEYIEHGSVKGGTLTALLKSDEVLNWNQQSNISWEMAMGFNALHQANIVHSDNKTDNILVYSETEVSTANVKWHIKISDLGLSHITQETARRGTPLWWAPEVFKDQGTTSIKSDVYAMGLVFWSVVSREKPFQEYQEVDEFQEDLTVQAVRPTMGKKFDEVPQRFASLIKRCWAQQPRQRPGCVEIIRELDEIQESDRFSAPVLH